MHSPHRSIFRPEAVRRYIEGREQVILPRFISPRVVVALWVLLALLAVLGIGLAFARVPDYRSGPAVIIAPEEASVALVAVFLPPDAQARPQVGQTLSLTFDQADRPLQRQVIAVESVLDRSAAVQRFGLDPRLVPALDGPATVVLARLGQLPAGIPAASAGRADVAVGSRRIGTLLPLVGQLFGE